MVTAGSIGSIRYMAVPKVDKTTLMVTLTTIRSPKLLPIPSEHVPKHRIILSCLSDGSPAFAGDD